MFFVSFRFAFCPFCQKIMSNNKNKKAPECRQKQVTFITHMVEDGMGPNKVDMWERHEEWVKR